MIFYLLFSLDEIKLLCSKTLFSYICSMGWPGEALRIQRMHQMVASRGKELKMHQLRNLARKLHYFISVMKFFQIWYFYLINIHFFCITTSFQELALVLHWHDTDSLAALPDSYPIQFPPGSKAGWQIYIYMSLLPVNRDKTLHQKDIASIVKKKKTQT
jgi:hypothetical protein